MATDAELSAIAQAGHSWHPAFPAPSLRTFLAGNYGHHDPERILLAVWRLCADARAGRAETPGVLRTNPRYWQALAETNTPADRTVDEALGRRERRPPSPEYLAARVAALPDARRSGISDPLEDA